MPTVDDIESWRPADLGELSTAWQRLGGHLQDCAGRLPRARPDVWAGVAADAAFDELASRAAATRALGRTLTMAAAAARDGAEQLARTRTDLVEVVRAARGHGYLVGADGTVSATSTGADEAGRAAELTMRVQDLQRRVVVEDNAAAAAVRAAFGSVGGPLPMAPAAPAETAPSAAEVVGNWPEMGQGLIADEIAGLTPDQRQALIEGAPRQVGNTDGVPWDMRVAANRINIADAIDAQQRLLDQPENDKIRSALAQGFGQHVAIPGGIGSDPSSQERFRAMVFTDPAWRSAAIAYHDRDARRHVEFYRGLLASVDDPTHRSAGKVPRQVLAFDPNRSSFVELHGDLGSATSVGVLVPGLNTTILDSAANTRTARRFVSAGGGEVAMITYLGGRFPGGDNPVSAVADAAEPGYALDMAPRLVAFSEDVDRTVDATGRHIPVTYVGHSYGGSILGTAERLGLTADRAVYVAAAGAGVGVSDESDWHNRNPDVERYAMTAPDDPIGWVQGLPFGPHGADPAELGGVWSLDTGLRLDGQEMSGMSSHSDVVNEPSDAWQRLLGVITGRPGGR